MAQAFAAGAMESDASLLNDHATLRGQWDTHCRNKTVTGEHVLIWQSWSSFIESCPGFVNRGLLTLDAAAAALSHCVDRYGALVKSAVTPVHEPTGSGRRAITAISFAEVHTLVWDRIIVQPLDNFLLKYNNKKLRKSAECLDEAKWEHAAHFLVGSMVDDVKLMAPISIEELCNAVAELVRSVAGVCIDKHLLQEHVAPLCREFGSSLLLAHTVCRSDILAEVTGQTLARAVRSSVHFIFHNALPQPADGTTLQLMLQELVETKQAFTKFKSAAAAGFVGHFDFAVESKGDTMITRTQKMSARDEHTMLNSATVEWALNSNIAFKNAPTSIVGAERLIRLMTTGVDSDHAECIEKLCSSKTYGRHALVLDTALDKMLADKIQKAMIILNYSYIDSSQHSTPQCI